MNEFPRVAVHEIVSSPEYEAHIDEHRRGQDTFLLMHIRVHSFSPATFKKIKTQWRLLRQCVTAPLFALAEVDDEKWERFVSHLGFKFLQEVICENGESRRLFIHVVQPPCNGKQEHLCPATALRKPKAPPAPK